MTLGKAERRAGGEARLVPHRRIQNAQTNRKGGDEAAFGIYV